MDPRWLQFPEACVPVEFLTKAKQKAHFPISTGAYAYHGNKIIMGQKYVWCCKESTSAIAHSLSSQLKTDTPGPLRCTQSPQLFLRYLRTSSYHVLNSQYDLTVQDSPHRVNGEMFFLKILSFFILEAIRLLFYFSSFAVNKTSHLHLHFPSSFINLQL